MFLFIHFVMWLIYYSICKKLASNKEKVKLHLTLIPIALFSLVVCADSMYVYIVSTLQPEAFYNESYPFILFKFFRTQVSDGILGIFLEFVKKDIINSAIIFSILAISYLLELRKKD